MYLCRINLYHSVRDNKWIKYSSEDTGVVREPSGNPTHVCTIKWCTGSPAEGIFDGKKCTQVFRAFPAPTHRGMLWANRGLTIEGKSAVPTRLRGADSWLDWVVPLTRTPNKDTCYHAPAWPGWLNVSACLALFLNRLGNGWYLLHTEIATGPRYQSTSQLACNSVYEQSTRTSGGLC